jgi:hypothetical protein
VPLLTIPGYLSSAPVFSVRFVLRDLQFIAEIQQLKNKYIIAAIESLGTDIELSFATVGYSPSKE